MNYRNRLRAAHRAAALLVAIQLLLAGLLSCGRDLPPPAALVILDAMQAAADGLPAGLLYDRRADPAGSGYLDGVLFSALYGPAARNCFDSGQDADGQPTAPLASDGALFLSAVPHPAELAVLQCPDRASALSVAALCRARLEGLRSAWAGTDYAAWAEAGDVTVADGFVLFAVCPDADRVLRAGSDAVRRRT